jgi:Kef-type K+ transport system membrane component KefB
VLLLIVLGIVLRIIVDNTQFKMPNIEPILPLLGTLGLILIVMEASLDLKLNRKKRKVIFHSVSSAVLLLSVFTAVVAYVLHAAFKLPWQTALLNTVPLAIISSAVAIPAASNLGDDDREFVVYESSFSDILGILVFDFIAMQHASFASGLLNLVINGLITFVISVVMTIGLAILLHRTKQHVNYVIIMTFIVLIYILAKMVHLPALLLILVFGMVLSNHLFFNIPFTAKFINFEKFSTDISSFKIIARELTFLVRSFFFIIFGYFTELDQLLNFNNFVVALCIILFIILVRWPFFKYVLRKEVSPLFFYAPRGLITILLFLSIPEVNQTELINQGLVTQVIFISIVVMSIGNMVKTHEKVEFEVEAPAEEDEGLEG